MEGRPAIRREEPVLHHMGIPLPSAVGVVSLRPPRPWFRTFSTARPGPVQEVRRRAPLPVRLPDQPASGHADADGEYEPGGDDSLGLRSEPAVAAGGGERPTPRQVAERAAADESASHADTDTKVERSATSRHLQGGAAADVWPPGPAAIARQAPDGVWATATPPAAGSRPLAPDDLSPPLHGWHEARTGRPRPPEAGPAKVDRMTPVSERARERAVQDPRRALASSPAPASEHESSRRADQRPAGRGVAGPPGAAAPTARGSARDASRSLRDAFRDVLDEGRIARAAPSERPVGGASVAAGRVTRRPPTPPGAPPPAGRWRVEGGRGGRAAVGGEGDAETMGRAAKPVPSLPRHIVAETLAKSLASRGPARPGAEPKRHVRIGTLHVTVKAPSRPLSAEGRNPPGAAAAGSERRGRVGSKPADPWSSYDVVFD